MTVLCILLCVAFASGFYVGNNETHEEKILQGDFVRIEDFPYQASLFEVGTDTFCGATIIHTYWVITGAHCVYNRSHILVRTGSGYRQTLGTVHRVEDVIKPDDFDINIKDKDIALIKLVEPIEFNNKQQPIKPAKPHDIPRQGESMWISGFGRVGPHPSQSHILKAAYVFVTNQESCETTYRGSHHITDKMFCAGNGNGEACYGDSGGPGVMHGKLYGIVSFGADCESSIFPRVYTSVSKYYHWIEEKSGLRF